MTHRTPVPPRAPARSARVRLLAGAVALLLPALGGAVAQGGPAASSTTDVPVDVAPAEDRLVCRPIDRDRLACYEKPRLSDFALSAPGNLGSWAKQSFRRDNALPFAALVASTAGLLMVDQDLADGAKRVGRWAHISGDGRTGVVPGVLIPYPTDVGSALYYIGDGMLPVTLTAGMLGYGLVASDRRAVQTAAHLTTGLVSVAIVAQTLKHLTGRQSPSRATEPGGRWRPLPAFSAYFDDVPAYDAFPSGHMATAMVTVTVLAEDFPEYRLIRPIGYGLMGLLGFQMMNNDVHWASDYPLAIAIGYGLGKAAVARGRTVLPAGAPEAQPERPGVTLLPLPIRDGGGLALLGLF